MIFGNNVNRVQDLGAIALFNPKLAWLLLQAAPKDPRILTMEAEFSSGGKAGDHIDMSLDRFIASDTWVVSLSHTVRFPNQAPCSLLKGLSDCTKNCITSIDVEARVEGPYRWIITDMPTPLEIFASGESVWPPLWVLTRGDNLIVRLFQRRAWCDTIDPDTGAPNGEVPVQVQISLKVVQLGVCEYRDMNYDQAVENLRCSGVMCGVSGPPKPEAKK